MKNITIEKVGDMTRYDGLQTGNFATAKITSSKPFTVYGELV
jgi:hypothetical protein